MSSGDAVKSEEVKSEGPTQITFNVKSSSDARHTITIADNVTVADLKQKLSGQDYADIPPERQRLIYSGRVMKDPEPLALYKIKDGNTVHLVKGAASNQQRNPETASSNSQVPPNAGVPQNLATGSGTDPLTGLTGARYAGFAQMPGAGMFGPDGGMGAPQSPDEMLQMLENPMVQQQFNEAMNNPHVIRMLQDNPMLRDQPMMREMLNNPEFRRMMFDPQFLRQSIQMQRIMGGGGRGAGGGAGGMPAPGMTDMTPQPEGQQQQQGQGQGQNLGAQGGAPQGQQGASNPFSMLGGLGGAQGNPFAMLGGMGGMNPSGQSQQQQPPNPAATSPPPTSNTTNQQPPSTPGSGNQPNSSQQQFNPFASLFTPQPGQAPGQAPSQGNNPMWDMMQRMMQDPEAMRMAQNMAAGGLGGMPSAGQQQAQQQGQQQGQPGQQGQQAPGANPFASLFNPAMGGMGGFGAPTQQQDSRPPEEQYAEQLRQLNEMGLHDFNRNVRALRMSGGHVEGAVDLLFSGQV